jgi:PPOX class probable F420-dependent enzyme
MEGKYINVISYTKNGDPIPTTVWFVEQNDKIHIATSQKRYKLRRIRNNPNVKVTRSGFLGKTKEQYVDVIARILSDEEFKSIIKLFKKKYLMFTIMFKENKEGDKKAFGIEITLN